MKTIYIENGIIMYYGSRAGQVTGGCATADPMFQGPELTDFLNKQRNIQDIHWMDGIYDRLMNAPKDAGIHQMTLKNVRVWQLKPEVDIHMKFIGYEEMNREFGPPNSENYQVVYDGAAQTNDLEALYTKFNTELPESFTGHSLSMSDVLELYDEQGSTFHYVDRIGFKQIDFKPAGQTFTHTMQL